MSFLIRLAFCHLQKSAKMYCILFSVARQVALLGKLLCDVSVPSLPLSQLTTFWHKKGAGKKSDLGWRGGGGVREMYIA
jgi:hypothetical protein